MSPHNDLSKMVQSLCRIPCIVTDSDGMCVSSAPVLCLAFVLVFGIVFVFVFYKYCLYSYLYLIQLVYICAPMVLCFVHSRFRLQCAYIPSVLCICICNCICICICILVTAFPQCLALCLVNSDWNVRTHTASALRSPIAAALGLCLCLYFYLCLYLYLIQRAHHLFALCLVYSDWNVRTHCQCFARTNSSCLRLCQYLQQHQQQQHMLFKCFLTMFA